MIIETLALFRILATSVDASQRLIVLKFKWDASVVVFPDCPKRRKEDRVDFEKGRQVFRARHHQNIQSARPVHARFADLRCISVASASVHRSNPTRCNSISFWIACRFKKRKRTGLFHLLLGPESVTNDSDLRFELFPEGFLVDCCKF